MEQIIVKVPKGSFRIKEGNCPNGHSLMNSNKLLSGKPAISTRVRVRSEESQIHFNPYYGIYEYDCDLELHPGDVVELFCPRCGVSLSVEELCAFCRVHMFAIQLPDGGEVRACPLVGCRNHHLTIVDLDAQLAAFYEDETRPKM
jgi:hypothetical protein